ncbi:PH domain-containing protein [Coniochaeta ligniaria NRRL 30616]|uniref:PH domain-containing protein n=1 Tax=Coniochaeta ligniaria NRRL 30616 TaxID=1408157 RepID=A0A1J7JJW3_9PEZI|nr:PH domain-containing protein [Coniochaeta ligniaria NRRL 30616]
MADAAPTAAGKAQAAAPAPAPASQPKSASPAIPVVLNEASLDSPTFRAVTVHFSEQVDSIERWLDSYMRSTSKLTHDMLALEETINTYLSKLVPPLPTPNAGSVDALLDPDYTLLALGRTAEGAREWWNRILASMRKLEGISVEPIRAFVGGDLRTFKEVRRTLDAAQKVFDTTLARYVGQSKTKEPSSLREDAFAVYETRKAYLKASMDFCMLAPQLRFTLDKLLVRVSADVYKEMKRSREGAASSMKWSEEMERIRGWSKEMEASEAVFKRELQIARRDIGESTLVANKPSRELDDYSASTVPFLGSRGPMSVQRKDQAAVISEKQGWLFLRVLSGKPVRTSWLRRWYYCRDGTFGWLAQAPLGVVQGDEIGVLLCSVKPAVQEDRRFCFEVKTKTQTLMLQAETQGELIEWLEVFEVAKKKAFEMSMGRDNSSLPGGVDPAFAVTPASIPEFSAKSLEGSDDGINPPERMGTLPIPGPDGNLASRASFDVNSTAPRRSLTTLGTTLAREEGESGREHAARLMQKLDLHRKSGPSNTGDAGAAPSAGAGGIASLISASHTLIPNYGTPALVPAPSPRQPPPNLSLLLEQRPGSLAPNTMARSPVPTYLSKNAVTAAAERGIANDGPRGIAAAVMANYWGTSPWSSMYNDRSDTVKGPLLDIDDPFVQSTTQITLSTDDNLKSPISPVTPITPSHRKAMSADAKIGGLTVVDKKNTEQFPPGYPNELKAHAAQFRLLFPSAPLEEKLVLVFNAAWASASEDSKEVKSFAGNGRIYVTPDNMYFYGHQMGLVVAYTISLDVITEVTAAPGRDCDYIFLHLGQDMNDTGLTRVTIKVFLEDLPLLHSRLNLLIDDLQAEEPMDLPELINALVNLEKEEYEKPSPSVESWEEVSSNTPVDDGTAHGKPVARRVGELGHRYRSPKSTRSQVAKFQLPARPVIYEPEGMGKAVAGRHFEISAKACFHVLFGDKSFIFPKLYFERRAIEIAQGPWELQDHGTLRRQFKFKVDYVDMLGRKKPGEVTDTQAIDVFSDHISYVVTHNKTPWHLPHSQAFKIVTKIVITHVAKSKCKLAIFTTVDWSKTPTFSKNMVNRQALDDAVNDAEELAEIATDQVRRLGPHSRTKRAIQVYGNIGQQTQVVVFTPSEADLHKKEQMIEPRTLTDMMIETVRSFMESAITSVMMWAFAGVRALFSVLTANRMILLMLGASVLYNMVVVSQVGSTWWSERKAARYMNRIGVGPNVMMSKAVYLVDLEEASRGTSLELAVPRDSMCYSTFQAIVNTTDMDAPYEATALPVASEGTARRLRRTRQRLGSYRHDLVVAMRIVNGVEREVIQSEWENWLADENVRCEQARSILQQSGEKDKDGLEQTASKKQQQQLQGVLHRPVGPERMEALRKWHQEYCGSCHADRQALMAQRNSLV